MSPAEGGGPALERTPLVALLTDFGDSEYVGVMKGVIARLWPQGTVVDLCHTVGAQAIKEGAWILWTSYRHFPSGTLFLAVVDPGVGTDRPGVAVQTRRYRWVGPDNGLLYPAAREDGVVRAVRLPVPTDASPTFHGRDVFAPAAARWAAGSDLAELGSPHESLVALEFFRRGRTGEVVRVDRFGNLITSLPVPSTWAYGQEVAVTIGGRRPPARARFVRTYGEAEPGQLVVVVGSAGTLEVSVVAGSAAARLEARPGVRLSIREVASAGRVRR